MGIEPDDTDRINVLVYFPSLSKYTLSLLHRTELALHKLHRKQGIDCAKHRHSSSAIGCPGHVWWN